MAGFLALMICSNGMERKEQISWTYGIALHVNCLCSAWSQVESNHLGFYL